MNENGALLFIKNGHYCLQKSERPLSKLTFIQKIQKKHLKIFTFTFKVSCILITIL